MLTLVGRHVDGGAGVGAFPVCRLSLFVALLLKLKVAGCLLFLLVILDTGVGVGVWERVIASVLDLLLWTKSETEKQKSAVYIYIYP